MFKIEIGQKVGVCLISIDLQNYFIEKYILN